MRQLVGPSGSRGIPPVRHSRHAAASAAHFGAGAHPEGRRLHKWAAAFSVVALLLLGSSPAYAEEVVSDPAAAASSEAEAPVVTETAPPPPAAPVVEPPAPPTEAAPAATDVPAAPPEAPPTTDGSTEIPATGAPATDDGSAPPAALAESITSAPMQVPTPDPFSPPYLRWMVTDPAAGAGAAITVSTTFTLQGPRNPAAATDADEAALWDGALIATVEDNTGQADYSGADLDVRVGWFAVMHITDDVSAAPHEVTAGEQYRVRANVAPEGYATGEEASWTSLDVLIDTAAVPSTVALATPASAPVNDEASGLEAAALGDVSVFSAPVGAQTSGPYKSDSDWNLTSDWYWSGSAASAAEMHDFTSSAVKTGNNWVLHATWTRPVTGGTQGWVIEYTNAAEAWGKRDATTPDSELVPRPDRSQGGTVIKINPSPYQASICTYNGQGQYPQWNQTLNALRCSTQNGAVTTSPISGGGERVTLALTLPSNVIGVPENCTPIFGSTGYIRSWTGNYNIQAWTDPIDFIEPTPCASTTINITKVGDRTGPGLTDGAPVTGATYTAYSSTSGQNPTPTGVALGTCITDALGKCSIVVTNTYANGVWIVETGLPDGWSNLPDLGIGGYNSAKTPTPYQFRVPVGTGTTNQVKNVSADSNRPNTTQSGAWVNMRNNPEFPESCGISIATVFDTSTSISETEMDSFKAAAQLFVGTAGLGGTPSTMTMFRFSTTAQTMNGGVAYDLAVPGSVVSNTGYLGAANRISTGLPSEGDGFTNWDAALRLVKNTGDYDMVLFLTDGDPTTYNDGTNTDTTVNFRGIEQAVMSANALKSEIGPSLEHTKIVGVGVGLSSGSDKNLQAITGLTINDDYFLAGNFDALQDKLAEIAQKNCGGTLTIVKQLQNASGQVISANTAGWEFTASGTVVDGSPATQTTTTSGTNFTLSFTDAQAHVVTIAETPQAGYTYVSSSCTNAAGEVVQTTTGFTVPISRNLITSCTVINREVPAIATVQLDKTWIVQDPSGNTLATYHDRGVVTDPAVPAWMDAEPTLTPGPDPMPINGELEWGATYSGFVANQAVTPGEDSAIDLSQAPGCMITSQVLTHIDGIALPVVIDDNAVGDFPAQTLHSGENVFGISNFVTCTTQLTLLKQVDLTLMPTSTLQPSDWTLSAAAGSSTPVLNGVTGASEPAAANTAAIEADTNYQLSEASVSGQLAYVQLGIQECTTVTGFGPTATCAVWSTSYISGNEIQVGLGHHGIYRFVNQPIPPLAIPLTGGMSAELVSLGGAGILLLALLIGVITTQRRSRRQWEVR